MFPFPLACPFVGDVLPFFAGAALAPLTPGLAVVIPGFFDTVGLAAVLPVGFCVVVLLTVLVAGEGFFGGISAKSNNFAVNVDVNNDLLSSLERQQFWRLYRHIGYYY